MNHKREIRTGDYIQIEGWRQWENHSCADEATLRYVGDGLAQVISSNNCDDCWQIGHNLQHVFMHVGDLLAVDGDMLTLRMQDNVWMGSASAVSIPSIRVPFNTLRGGWNVTVFEYIIPNQYTFPGGRSYFHEPVKWALGWQEQKEFLDHVRPVAFVNNGMVHFWHSDHFSREAIHEYIMNTVLVRKD